MATKRVAIVSDIHGNYEALLAVDADIRSRKADEIWCSGDIIGYGPHPLPCLEWTAQNCSFVTIGNHDQALLDVLDDPEKLLELYGQAVGTGSGISWTIKQLIWDQTRIKDKSLTELQKTLELITRLVARIKAEDLEKILIDEADDARKKISVREALSDKGLRQKAANIEYTLARQAQARKWIAWLRKLKTSRLERFGEDYALIVHDNIVKPGDGRYMLDKDDPGYHKYTNPKNYADEKPVAIDALHTIGLQPEHRLVVAGHSHHQRAIFNPHWKNWFLNPGTVGMQRKKVGRSELPQAEYAIATLGSEVEIELIQVPYNVNKVRDQMRRAGLPDKLGETLTEKLD